jgi:septum formation protein
LRRRDLLARAGLEFEVDVPDVDESVAADLSPEEAACMLAERKARAVLMRHPASDVADSNIVVLAADTIVAVGTGADARLLGKPADAAEARAMLRALSGTRHRVVTGVCALANGARACTAFERTWVTMRAIEPAEIEAYVQSGEWRDNAGGGRSGLVCSPRSRSGSSLQENHEIQHPSQVPRVPGHLRLRQHLPDARDRQGNAHRDLLGVPSVLFGQAEVRRRRRPRGPLQEALRVDAGEEGLRFVFARYPGRRAAHPGARWRVMA